jgi:hypothetical protein
MVSIVGSVHLRCCINTLYSISTSAAYSMYCWYFWAKHRMGCGHMCLLRYDILRWWSKSSRENSWWPQQVPNEQGYVHSIGFTLTADSLHIREPWRASQNCSGRSPWIGVGSLLRWQQARFKSLGRTYLQLKADYKYVMYEHHLTQETVPDTWSVRPMLRILQRVKHNFI